MKKQVHTSLTLLIAILAFSIAIGNAATINMRWITAFYWLLIFIRVSMELPWQRKSKPDLTE